MALVIGTGVGLAVSQIPLLRRAIGSMLAALQTMPSIVWFPLAILLFQLSETAIFFVVVLGAAPSIANGLISGVDHIPPLWLRAGRVLGARRLRLAPCRDPGGGPHLHRRSEAGLGLRLALVHGR